MTRVLICGSRDWPETGAHEDIILNLLRGYAQNDTLTLIEGCARGADDIAHRFGERVLRAGRVDNFEHLHFPAEWDRLGISAGLVRNRRMLEEGKPDVVYGFAYGTMTKGTLNMTSIAQEAGVPTFIVFGPKL